MTTRKYAITPTKSPQLTGGDDRPEPACLGKSEPYDVLIEGTVGPGARVALREAVKLCRSCPIALQCFTENAEEPWVKAIREAKNAPRDRPECGSNWGVRKHGHAKESACEKCKVYMREKAARRQARKSAEVAA